MRHVRAPSSSLRVEEFWRYDVGLDKCIKVFLHVAEPWTWTTTSCRGAKRQAWHQCHTHASWTVFVAERPTLGGRVRTNLLDEEEHADLVEDAHSRC